ncbi:MAG: hypothetical protein QM737_15540 [Ferruginibacter sp.]
MRINLLLLTILLASLKAFSQDVEIIQLPIVYKQNNVKARIRLGLFKAINYFNHDGLLSEIINISGPAKNYIYGERFEYDSAQNLITDTCYRIIPKDSSKKPYPDIHDTIYSLKLEHDSLHRLIKINIADTSMKVYADFSFSYDPYIKTRKYFGWQSDSTVIVIQYDEYLQEKNINSTTYDKNGKLKYSSFMEYKNIYNKSGRLKKRKVKTSLTPFDSQTTYSLAYPVKHEYTYLKNGLLSEITTTNGEGRVFKTSFEYEYW